MKKKITSTGLFILMMIIGVDTIAQHTFYLHAGQEESSKMTNGQTALRTNGWNLVCPGDIQQSTDVGVCGATVNYIPPGIMRTGYFTQTPGAVLDANPITCVNNETNLPSAEASYVRVYDFPAMGHPYGFELTSVTFGVRWARSPSGASQTVQVRAYSWDPTTPLAFSSFTQLASVPVVLEPQIRTFKTVALVASVPAGSALVLEIYSPNNTGTDFRFLMGGTNGAETGFSYVRTNCEDTLIKLSESFMNPTYKWVIDANGNYLEPAQQTTGLPPGSLFPIGTTINSFTMTEDGITSSCSFQVTVVDNEAPVISGLSTSPGQLWPVNHKMVNVAVNYNVTDNCPGGDCEITSISSNEPVYGTGDGDTGPDWEIVNNHLVKLRAERSGNGTGRIYTINLRCTDAAGNASTSSIQVHVPKSMGMNRPAPEVAISGMKIFPNPVKGNLQLQLSTKVTSKGIIIVSDLSGREIIKQEISSGDGIQLMNFDMKKYPAGQYIARWITSTGIETRKFILSHE